MTQRWLMRVASHKQHGGGHVSRCTTLALALVQAGARPLLWLDPGSPEAADRFASIGLEWTADTSCPVGPWHGSVIDGYDMAQDAAKLAKYTAPMVVLDDFLSPPPGTALLVNSAFGLTGDSVDGVPALLGPPYALVAPRFSAIPVQDRRRPVQEILVTFGRIDPDNATVLALEALARTGTKARITVVIPATSPHTAAIETALQALGGPKRIYSDLPDMLPLLEATDLVIGAGGVSLMERIAAGIPSVTIAIADNQRLIVEGAARSGSTLMSAADPDALAKALRMMLIDAGARERMSIAGRQLIDGNGAMRVARKMIHLAETGRSCQFAKGFMSI